jgi:hypothetical protein
LFQTGDCNLIFHTLILEENSLSILSVERGKG